MKSTILLAIAATVATVASAEQLKYGAPIASTTWTVGSDATISWTNNCQGLTSTTFPVVLQIQRADGVQTPVSGIPPLGQLNCASSGSLTVKVPSVPTGSLYSILVSNSPDLSYSALFTINNPALPGANATASVTATPATRSATATASGTASATVKPSVSVTSAPKPTSAAGTLKAGSAAALAVAGAVAALIF
jgi:hypothetical protein